jgi:hypothetical protein
MPLQALNCLETCFPGLACRYATSDPEVVNASIKKLEELML